MHKFRKQWRQEPPRKLCKVCEFTCLTTGGPRFHQNAKHSGLEGPQEIKCALCDYTNSKMTPSVNTESESTFFLNKINEEKKHCYSVKSLSFHFRKKAFLLSICTENMILLSNQSRAGWTENNKDKKNRGHYQSGQKKFVWAIFLSGPLFCPDKRAFTTK